MTMMDALADQGPLMKAWFAWMFLMNLSSLIFVKNQVPARWIFAAMVGNVIGMATLLRTVGPGPLTSIPHIVLWTPLLVYLVVAWKHLERNRMFGYWLIALMVTDGVSLILDYRAMIYYLLRSEVA